MRGGSVFSDYARQARRCLDCQNPSMELLESGGWDKPNRYRCQKCGKTYERESSEQLAKGGLNLWWKVVKFLHGVTK